MSRIVCIIGRCAVWLVCASSLPAQAHDLWLEKTGKHFVLYQGHRHSAHAGAETLPYDKQFVTGAQCLDARAALRPLTVIATAPWSATGDCAALIIDVSSGDWSKTPWETKNVPKSEAPGAIKSWRSKERLKYLTRWSPAFAKPFADGLEIVPVSDPFALKPGDKLLVQVFTDRQPLANAPVAYHGEPRGATDAEGRIAIRLRHGGLQLIATSFERPLKDGKADVEMLTATLQFELPQ
jgi:nickel transport protein